MIHLEEHKELYWSVGFLIDKRQFSFPIFGFIHVSGGGRVEYRALVNDIVRFAAKDYESLVLKPALWRERWANDPSYPFKNSLVMTELVPFSFDTYQFEKYDGGQVTHPPQGYVRVIPPNQLPASTPAHRSRTSIAEKNLQDFVIQQLYEIEPGLRLVSKELSTPAGRLDLLCRDIHGNYVVVELKKTQGTDQVVGQILRYMGWVHETYPESKVRGIIIVGKIDDRCGTLSSPRPLLKQKNSNHQSGKGYPLRNNQLTR